MVDRRAGVYACKHEICPKASSTRVLLRPGRAVRHALRVKRKSFWKFREFCKPARHTSELNDGYCCPSILSDVCLQASAPSATGLEESAGIRVIKVVTSIIYTYHSIKIVVSNLEVDLS
jgi:hypothetical protein